MTVTEQDIKDLLDDRSHSEVSRSERSYSEDSGEDSVQDSRQSSHYFSAPVGTLMNDRYELSETIGHGRFSKVFAAYDLKNDRRNVALKIYRTSSEFYEYFKNELALYEHLNSKTHCNVVSCLDTFVAETDQGSHGVVVLEKFNRDIKHLIETHDSGLPQSDVYKILHQVCQGLSFLHENDIIHADIKPENLLIDDDFNVKICDIGSGMLVDEIESFHVGTIPYISPELILGVPYDFKIDIWSTGCLMFELLTGECLFDPDLYFESDIDTDEDEEQRDERRHPSGEHKNDTACDDQKEDASQSVSMDRYSPCPSEEEGDVMEGYEWELNHFQLCAFKSIIGRIPVDKFRDGRYFDLFFNEIGRLRNVPRCIDNRGICDILIEDFDHDPEKAMRYQEDILKMLVIDPDHRPSSSMVAQSMQENFSFAADVSSPGGE